MTTFLSIIFGGFFIYSFTVALFFPDYNEFEKGEVEEEPKPEPTKKFIKVKRNAEWVDEEIL